jgi:hypothetical protein
MTDENECRLTGRRCYRTHYGDERCSSDPTPQDAVDCIRTLDDRRADMEKELADMDKWIESIKKHADSDTKTPETKH